MSYNQLMSSITSNSKLGYTTTVKDQVEEIENRIEHFKKTLESQKKQHNQLHFQIRKLEENTRTSFGELNKEISERVNYLSDLFKNDTRNQNKEFDYLELQNSTLQSEHDKLNQLTNSVGTRTQEVENNVGM